MEALEFVHREAEGLGNSVQLYPKDGNVRCWPVDLMCGYGNAQLVTCREGSVESVVALRGGGGPTKNKVIYVMPDEPRTPAAYDPFEGVSDHREYFWR